MSVQSHIRVVGASVHNLQHVSVNIPRAAVTTITGVSGSGKSSLAFDTIHAEGQRRYVESLSLYARQFLEQLQKPDVERIEGLSPTIAIEQRVSQAGPRATVATSTDIHDFLRVLFARAGVPHCLVCGRPMAARSVSQIVAELLRDASGKRAMVLAPLVRNEVGAQEALITRLIKDGFVRARIDGTIVMLDESPALAPDQHHTIDLVVDRLVLKSEGAARVAESVELASRMGGGRILVCEEQPGGAWSERAYSTILACPDHPESALPELTPKLFSFNSPQGACSACTGLGRTMEFDVDLVIPDRQRSLEDGAVAAWRASGQRLSPRYSALVDEFCQRFGVSPDTPLQQYSETVLHILLNGTTEQDVTSFGAEFEGVLPNLRRLWTDAKSESLKERLHAFLSETPCTTCRGARLRPEALCVRIAGQTIADLGQMTIERAGPFFSVLTFEGEAAVVAEPLLRDMGKRLNFLKEVGVGYLTLDRASMTLSGGEWQRLRLATQIGGGLSGVCYVLDEPTIGLHPRDSRQLCDILRRLAELDNTVIVVEHDSEVIGSSDHLIDVGPGAGEQGGRIVAEGTPDEIRRNPASLTGRYLAGELAIDVPASRKPPDPQRLLVVRGAQAHNLRDVTARFPLGHLICVTGVSGSGKSTLVSKVLVRALRRQLTSAGPRPGEVASLEGANLVQNLVEIEQAPLARSPRGNSATFAGLMPPLRELFAKTREAKIRGYGPNRFSFNSAGGRCPLCQGRGTKRIVMHFLPDVFVPCEECGGRRYNRETLEIRFRGKNIADVLDMRVEEALVFFENFEVVRKRLQLLNEVGLGYVALGQSLATLSGGEAQRLKLATELQRGGDGHTLYVLDEPTMGLHFDDVRKLLLILNRLVDRGHTVLCIEHNLDVIKCADWVIDLGPEGGEAGGRIVAEGTPEDIASNGSSYTGQFLRSVLTGRTAGRAPKPAEPALDQSGEAATSSPPGPLSERKQKNRPAGNRKR